MFGVSVACQSELLITLLALSTVQVGTSIVKEMKPPPQRVESRTTGNGVCQGLQSGIPKEVML